VRAVLREKGPLRGIEAVFGMLDKLSRDELIDFICPGKFYAWNLQPSKEGKSGSVEFRRAPSVVSSKKAKHWVAFTMAFVWMSIKFESKKFIDAWATAGNNYRSIFHPDFQQQLLYSARDIGEYWNLDTRLLQIDDVANLHITMMSEQGFSWLSDKGLGYNWSTNR
jgi:hypothetical protein